MDVKRAIRDVAWMSRMAPVASQDDIFKKSIRNLKITKQLDEIDCWADMAEAAIALAEHQATSGYDPAVDSKAYTAERGRLWDAFLAARAKAKAITQQ